MTRTLKCPWTATGEVKLITGNYAVNEDVIDLIRLCLMVPDLTNSIYDKLHYHLNVIELIDSNILSDNNKLAGYDYANYAILIDPNGIAKHMAEDICTDPNTPVNYAISGTACMIMAQVHEQWHSHACKRFAPTKDETPAQAKAHEEDFCHRMAEIQSREIFKNYPIPFGALYFMQSLITPFLATTETGQKIIARQASWFDDHITSKTTGGNTIFCIRETFRRAKQIPEDWKPITQSLEEILIDMESKLDEREKVEAAKAALASIPQPEEQLTNNPPADETIEALAAVYAELGPITSETVPAYIEEDFSTTTPVKHIPLPPQKKHIPLPPQKKHIPLPPNKVVFEPETYGVDDSERDAAFIARAYAQEEKATPSPKEMLAAIQNSQAYCTPVQATQPVETIIRCVANKIYDHIFKECKFVEPTEIDELTGATIVNENPGTFRNLDAASKDIDLLDIPGATQITERFVSTNPLGQLSAISSHGNIRGYVKPKALIPAYEVIFKDGDKRISRLFMPQNPNKMKDGKLSPGAKMARQGHKILWIIDPDVDDHTVNVARVNKLRATKFVGKIQDIAYTAITKGGDK